MKKPNPYLPKIERKLTETSTNCPLCGNVIVHGYEGFTWLYSHCINEACELSDGLKRKLEYDKADSWRKND